MRYITPQSRFSFLLHDVSRMRRTFIDQALKPLGITRAQWWALGNLSRHSDEGMVQTDLAMLLEMGKVSTGGLIDRLEEAGLVHRQPDASDRRIKRIFMTDRGFEMLEHIAEVGKRLDLILFKDISDEQIAMAADILTQAKANLREARTVRIVAEPLPSPKGNSKESLDSSPRKKRASAARRLTTEPAT